MRIALFHDLPSGGAKRAVHRQALGLVARGHTVDVFVPSTAEEGFLPLDEIASSKRTFERPQPPNREQLLEGGASPLAPLHWLHYLTRVYRSELEITRAIDRGGYSAVLVHPTQFTQAPWLLRFLRTPSLYWCHEPLRSAHEPRRTTMLVKLGTRQVLGRIDRKNALAATRMAVNSRYSQQRVTSIYGRDAVLNYLGVDSEQFRPLPLGRGDFLLTVAALHPQKGLDFLIEAIGRVPARSRPPLLVVSDRARTAELERLQSQAALAGVTVDFRFRVGEDDLVRLYNQARVVLYAPRNEPFGLVPLEAMACGRPVVGVREGGIPETIVDGETGFLTDRDPAQFAARLHDLLSAPERAEALGSSARELTKSRWSWERSIAELEALLRF